MAWSSSNRKQRFNKGWAKTRAKILQRDGYRCQWPIEDSRGFPIGRCLAPARMVDHKIHNMAHDDDRESNLWALCDYHHAQKTAMESAEGNRKRVRRMREASFYDHPAFH